MLNYPSLNYLITLKINVSRIQKIKDATHWSRRASKSCKEFRKLLSDIQALNRTAYIHAVCLKLFRSTTYTAFRETTSDFVGHSSIPADRRHYYEDLIRDFDNRIMLVLTETGWNRLMKQGNELIDFVEFLIHWHPTVDN